MGRAICDKQKKKTYAEPALTKKAKERGGVQASKRNDAPLGDTLEPPWLCPGLVADECVAAAFETNCGGMCFCCAGESSVESLTLVWHAL